ncbi:unnamed protein product [Leptosia nina]|uniref:Uncharacterized protein n=1 Tax=Leptosia nina TaxID=320188 RepID=A0AAV1JUV4_9NEOP
MLLFLVSFLVMSTTVFGYDEKFNKIDVDKILADDNLLMAYLNCFLDKGPCDKEYAQDFRDILPEVIATTCGKCSDIQKDKVRKLINSLINTKPDLAMELKTKFDPEGKQEEKLALFLTSAK